MNMQNEARSDDRNEGKNERNAKTTVKKAETCYEEWMETTEGREQTGGNKR